MPVPVYDSPTFLGAKDKYMFGLTLPQLMIVFFVGVSWLMVCMMLPYGTIIRMGCTGAATVASAALLFLRISGISIPMYLFYTILRLFSKPAFEEQRDLLVGGNVVWLEQLEAGYKWYQIGFLRKKKAELETDEAMIVRMEMEAEVNRQMSNTATSMEQWMREGIRTVMGGRK